MWVHNQPNMAENVENIVMGTNGPKNRQQERHMFGRHWTPCSKYANHFSFNYKHVWSDKHNHFIAKAQESSFSQ